MRQFLRGSIAEKEEEMVTFKKLVVLALSMLLALSVTGCGVISGRLATNSEGSTENSTENNSQTEDSEQAEDGDSDKPETTKQEIIELRWDKYTMSIAEVTDNAPKSGTEAVKGRLVKVRFSYISDQAGHGGFYYGENNEMFDSVKESKIDIVDTKGNTYPHNSTIGNISFKGGNLSGGLVEAQSVFSLFFDIPVDIPVKDLSLVIYDQKVPLAPYLGL